MADIVIVDCSTGDETVRPLTANEQAQRDRDIQDWRAAEQAEAAAAAQAAAAEQAWRDTVSRASSIAELKAVLLGSNTPVSPVAD